VDHEKTSEQSSASCSMDRLLFLSVTPVALLVQFASHAIATHSTEFNKNSRDQIKFVNSKNSVFVSSLFKRDSRHIAKLAKDSTFNSTAVTECTKLNCNTYNDQLNAQVFNFIYLSICFCLTCFGFSLSPSSEAGVQLR
jgi:hypothetical protein